MPWPPPNIQFITAKEGIVMIPKVERFMNVFLIPMMEIFVVLTHSRAILVIVLGPGA